MLIEFNANRISNASRNLTASIYLNSLLSVNGLPRWLSGKKKNPPANAGDAVSIPVLARSPSVGNGNPLQYSCLENPVDGGVWCTTVYEVAKNWT